MNNIEVISEPTEEKPFLIINKPKGLPSAPLSCDDKENVISYAIKMFPQIENVVGHKKIEYGLVHRLDTVTDGLLVIATSQKCYDFFMEEQKNKRFFKYYTARCADLPLNAKELGGFPFCKECLRDTQSAVLSSYFRPFGSGSKEVRPVTEDSGKAALKKICKQKTYFTDVNIIDSGGKNKFGRECKIIKCKIAEGYRHQVRCHLAWAGWPVNGDVLYNADLKNEEKKNTEQPIEFSATKIEFEYPRGDLNSYEIALTWT